MLGVEVSVMTLEEFQTYLKRPATMEEAGRSWTFWLHHPVRRQDAPEYRGEQRGQSFPVHGVRRGLYRRFKSIMPPEEFFRHLQEMMDSRNAENAQDPA